MAEPTYKRVCRVIGELAGIDADGIGPGQSLGQRQTPNFYTTDRWTPGAKVRWVRSLERRPLAVVDLPELTIASRFAPLSVTLKECAGIVPLGWLDLVEKPSEPKPIGLDSLDLIQLAMGLEEEFDISISDAEVDDKRIDHVGGLVAFVQGKLDAMFCPPGFMGAPPGYHAVQSPHGLSYRRIVAETRIAFDDQPRPYRISDAAEPTEIVYRGPESWDGRPIPPAELNGDCS